MSINQAFTIILFKMYSSTKQRNELRKKMFLCHIFPANSSKIQPNPKLLEDSDCRWPLKVQQWHPTSIQIIGSFHRKLVIYATTSCIHKHEFNENLRHQCLHLPEIRTCYHILAIGKGRVLLLERGKDCDM
jgi:hypothetical protein